MQIKIYKGTEMRAFQMSMKESKYIHDTPEEYLEKNYTVTRDKELVARMLDTEPEIVEIDDRFGCFNRYDKKTQRRSEAEYNLSKVWRNKEGELVMSFNVAGVWSSGSYDPEYTVSALTEKFDNGEFKEYGLYR